MNTRDIALHHQRLVQELERVRAALTRLEQQRGPDAEAARLGAAVDEARARRQVLERRLREVDRDTEARRQKADGRERELMSGHLTNPANLIRLREEVDHLRQAVQAAEEGELSLLEDAERDDSALAALERALQARRADAASMAPDLGLRQAAATARQEVLEAEAQTAWEQLPADWQEAIQQVRSRHPDAVVEVRDGQCQGCHLAVNSRVVQALRHGGLHRCDSCGRLLVI